MKTRPFKKKIHKCTEIHFNSLVYIKLFHLQNKKKMMLTTLEAQMKIRIIPTRDNDSETWLLDVWLFYRYIEFAVT